MSTATLPSSYRYTLRKRERIASRKLLETMFAKREGSRQYSAYPLRLVSLERQRVAGEEPVQMLVSVPKKRLHHAVDRNRAKRQVREAYRLNRHILTASMSDECMLALAFIWVADEPVNTGRVAHSVKKLLERMSNGETVK